MKDNAALLYSVKATVGSSNQVDELDVVPRIEMSSSIFRGISCSISGVGNDVSADLIHSRIQNLGVVKKVSPVIQLRLLSPIDSFPHSAPGSRRDSGSLNTAPQINALDETTALSTHIM